MNKRLKDYYSNTNSDSACRLEQGRTSSVRKEIRGLLFKKINSDSACRFEKGRTSAVEKEIEELLFKYK